jgi:hypothetical protein
VRTGSAAFQEPGRVPGGDRLQLDGGCAGHDLAASLHSLVVFIGAAGYDERLGPAECAAERVK